MNGEILITGGAQRFGRALALALNEQGNRVIITYRQTRDSLLKLENAGIQCLQADFSSAVTTQAFIHRLREKITSLRAVVHNASDWLPETPDCNPAWVMETNWAVHVLAPYLMNLALADLLKKGASQYGQADIIHLSDYVAGRGSKKHIAYAASKAAMENMTLSFAASLAPDIKVNSIAPALLMFRDQDDGEYRERVAKKSLLAPGPGAREGIATVQMLLSSRYITGRSIPLDGGRHLKNG